MWYLLRIHMEISGIELRVQKSTLTFTVNCVLTRESKLSNEGKYSLFNKWCWDWIPHGTGLS